MTERTLRRIRTLPAASRGQFGPDHTAIEAIQLSEWADADPFILLMDDRVDGTLRAGPHPHAGFETVTFVVDGGMPAEHRGDVLSTGDVEWTTTGSGIVHGPDRPIEGRMRVLQLWLTLPRADRWTAPDHQFVRSAEALVRRETGAELRLYSGTTGDLVSPTRNRVPTTLVDVRLEPGASVQQALPATHNGFLYPLDGEVRVGADHQPLRVPQLGWLDRADDDGETTLQLANQGNAPARVLLYAAARQNIPIASYGPFIGDTREDIVQSIERYQAGTFLRV
jgi:redox-sensitive bicupin YhaK (pirin superfamily)